LALLAARIPFFWHPVWPVLMEAFKALVPVAGSRE